VIWWAEVWSDTFWQVRTGKGGGIAYGWSVMAGLASRVNVRSGLEWSAFVWQAGHGKVRCALGPVGLVLILVG